MPCLEEQKKSWISNLTFILKNYEKKNKGSPKLLKKEIIQIRAELNKIEKKKTIEKNQQRGGCLERLIK